MASRTWGVRLRSVVDSHFEIVTVVVVILAVLGGYLAVTAYAGSNTQTETVEQTVWESNAAFGHSATVVNETELFERGELLRNRSSYFRAITPRLNGTFRYSYSADDGTVDANASAALVLRSRSTAGSMDGNASTYWQTGTVIGRETGSLSPGEQLRLPFSANISAAAERLRVLDAEVGGTPGIKQLLVEVRLGLSGTRAGQEIVSTRTYQLPVSLSGNLYEVQDPGPITNSGTRTITRTVPAEPGILSAYGGPILLIGAIVGYAGLLAGRVRGHLSVTDTERRWLDYQNHRAEYEEWITVAETPEPRKDPVTVETLEGLANIAIDTNRRVLQDPDGEEYLVFADEWTYVYTPPNPDNSPLISVGSAAGTNTDSSESESSTADDAPTPVIESVTEDGETNLTIEGIDGIGPTYADRLAAAGFETVSDLADAETNAIADAAETSPTRAEKWIDRAQSES